MIANTTEKQTSQKGKPIKTLNNPLHEKSTRKKMTSKGINKNS